jgi:hypothetical protein
MKPKGLGVIIPVRKSDLITFKTTQDGFKYVLQFDEKNLKVMMFDKQLIK